MNAAEIKAMAENVIEHNSAGYAYFRCDRCATIARAYLRLLKAADKLRFSAGFFTHEIREMIRPENKDMAAILPSQGKWEAMILFNESQITKYDAAKEGE